MKSLEALKKEYGYDILSPAEVKSVRSGKLNWKSLEGEVIRRKCLRSYPAYLQATNYGYRMTPYHYSLSANLQKNYEKGPNPGMPYGLILLSASPQTGKSFTITKSFQSWVLTKDPYKSVLTLGYEADFTKTFGRANRDKFAEFALNLSGGKIKLHDKVQSTEDWETMVFSPATGLWDSTGGGMHTAGMGGAITGKTGNVVVIDDPIKNMKDADSEVKVADNIEYFQSGIETRLLGNPGSLCIVMCTRWVVNDLIGWLRRKRKKYIVGDYNYAAMCTEKNKATDPLGREVGEGICPEMGLDSKWAQEIKVAYINSEGSHVYNALFQGDPSDEQGSLFRQDNWMEYYIRDLNLSKCDRVYLSIDATFKDNKANDYVAMKVGAIYQGNDYWRYVVRKHLDLPDTLDKIIYLCKKFPEIDVIYIEDKANGPGIVSVLRKWRKKLGIDEKDFPSIYPLNPEGGKYSRAQAVAAYHRDGRNFIPAESDWAQFSSPEDFEWDDDLSYIQAVKHELSTFPFGANDDLVDCHSQSMLKNIGLMTGEEKPDKKPTRYSRYSVWDDYMEEDYEKLDTREEREAFIRMHGANIKWKPREGFGGVV